MGESDDLRKKIVEEISIGGVMVNIPLYETVDKLKKYFEQKYNAQELKEYEDLILELSKVNRKFFWSECYPKLIKKLLKKFPEKDILQIERNIFLYSMKDTEELIISDYLGKLFLSELDMVLEGHFFITNLFISGISWKTKAGTGGAMAARAVIPSRLLAQSLANRVIKKRTKFFAAIKQFFGILKEIYDQLEFYSEEIPFIPIIAPYNIEITRRSNLSFAVNYDYSYKERDMIKNKTIKVTFAIAPNQFKKESTKDFKQRKESLFSTIRDSFSKIPETTCTKCNHRQNKNLDNCEKCGTPLKNKL